LAARRQLLAPQPTFLACGSKEEDVYFRCCGGFAATTTEKIVTSWLPEAKRARCGASNRATA
jgi:hypothetical protein